MQRKIDKTIEITTTTSIELTGKDIIALINGTTSLGLEIPAGAEVTFDVPGGGDYSNETLQVKYETPITITWVDKENIDEEQGIF